MNKKGASVSPCKIPARIAKEGVSPSLDKTVHEVSVYNTLIASMIVVGIPYQF